MKIFLYRHNKYRLVLCVAAIAFTVVNGVVVVDINFVVAIVVVIIVYFIRVVVAVTAVVLVGVGFRVVVPMSNTVL